MHIEQSTKTIYCIRPIPTTVSFSTSLHERALLQISPQWCVVTYQDRCTDAHAEFGCPIADTPSGRR